MSETAPAMVDDVVVESGSRLRSAAKFSGYGLFFLLALLVSMVLTFPNRQLKGFVESQARKAGYPMSIRSMALTGLGGVSLEGVDITLPAPKGPDGKPKKGGKKAVLHLDTLDASVSLWPLITRSEVDGHFSLTVANGSIEDAHIKVRQGRKLAADASRKSKKGKKRKKSAKAGRKATLIDIDIPSIDRLDLKKLGVASRALGFTDKVGGDMHGSLSGAVNLHWEGTHEGAKGTIDLELADAVLHNPTVSIDAKGPPLELKDLRLGVVTVKVRIDEKGRINLLKSKRGVDSSTAIHLAGVDIFGKDLELVAEERSHVIIPPGRKGMRQGRMQVHLVFALPKSKARKKAKKRSKKGAKDAKGKKTDASAEADDGRASWDLVREMMTGKFKRFMRSGYLGMTCSGSLTRPTCTPSLPQVTVGTRKRARSEARKKAKSGNAAARIKAEAAARKKKAALEAKAKEAAAKKATPTKPKVKFEPAVRPGAKRKPTPRAGGDKGGVRVKQTGKKRAKRRDDDERDDDERDDDERDDDERDDDERDDDDDDDAPRKKKKKTRKSDNDDDDDDRVDDERGDAERDDEDDEEREGGKAASKKKDRKGERDEID